MGHHRRWVSFGAVASLVVALLFAAAGVSRADEPPGQKERRKKALAALDTKVRALVKLVRNVDKQVPCGGGAPTVARGRTRPPLAGGQFCPAKFEPLRKEIAALIDEVRANNGPDPRAGHVSSKWPDYLASLQTRLETDLSGMVGNRRSAAELTKQCADLDKRIVSRGKTALIDKSLDEFDVAQEAATADATIVREALATHAHIQSAMSQWERNTRLLELDQQYDEAWQPVVKALRASSKAMLDRWNTDWVAANGACEQPNLGEDHAGLRALEDQLFAALRQGLDADLAAWRTQATEFYRYDCDSMKELQDYYCLRRDADGEGDEAGYVEQDTGDDDDGHGDDDDDGMLNGDGEDLIYLDKAAKMEAAAVEKIRVARFELGGMSSRAQRLQVARNGRMRTADAYHAWVADLDAFIDELRAEDVLIEERAAAGVARGSNNPRLQLWMEFGKQQHERMGKDPQFNCRLDDVPFCARRRHGKCVRWRRPDCIDVDGCKIWEFKPIESKAKAEKQVADYKRMVERHYNFALKEQRAGTLSFKPVGGHAVFADIVKTCAVPDATTGTIRFAVDVEVYPKCDAKLVYQCGKTAK